MYTKKELKENEIIENAIHNNYKKIKRIYKQNKILDWILLTISGITFFIGILVLIAVIENLKI